MFAIKSEVDSTEEAQPSIPLGFDTASLPSGMGHAPSHCYIVVREAPGNCYARYVIFAAICGGNDGVCHSITLTRSYSPVSNYGGRGTSAPGVISRRHAIVYSTNTSPRYMPGEAHLQSEPIAVRPAEPTMKFSAAARINFGVQTQVSHNTKVNNLGMVIANHIPNLILYARTQSGW